MDTAARVRHERSPAAATMRRVAGVGNPVGRLLDVANQGKCDALGAEVESQLDRGFVDRRHAHEWGAGRAGGCRDLDMQAFGPVAPCSWSMTTQPTHAPATARTETAEGSRPGNRQVSRGSAAVASCRDSPWARPPGSAATDTGQVSVYQQAGPVPEPPSDAQLTRVLGRSSFNLAWSRELPQWLTTLVIVIAGLTVAEIGVR